MKASQLNSIMEGVVSTTGQGSQPFGQALTGWLRGMKETINLAARFVENDFLMYYISTTVAAEEPVTADGADTVYGILIRSTEDVIHLVQFWDAADGTAIAPGTTAVATASYPFLVHQCPAVAATTAPFVQGTVFYPYVSTTLGIQTLSVDISDGTTASTTSYVKSYTFTRNE